MQPAAILSIAVKADGIDKAKRDLGEVDTAGKRAGGSLGKFAKVAALGVAAGVGAAGLAVKKFVDAAAESEKSNAAMKAQLKALGIDYGKHASTIDKVIAKHSALSGLDDEDLQDSFTNIVRVTGDVNKALELNALAADFARAKGIDVAKAGELVGKVAGGNIGILSRYGIQIEKGATSSEALAEMQKRFAGQAEAYGNTAAGAQEKFQVALGNLQEMLGEKLLPVITKVTEKVAGFVGGLSSGEGAGGRFIAIIRGIIDWFVRWKDILIPVGLAIGVVAAGVGAYTAALKVAAAAQAAFNFVMSANPIGLVVIAIGALVAGIIYAYRESETFRDIVNGAFDAIKKVATPVVQWLGKGLDAAAKAAENVGKAVKWAFQNVILPVVQAVIPYVVKLLEGLWKQIKGLVNIVVGLLSGDFSRAWEGVKDIVEGAIGNLLTVLDAARDLLKLAGEKLLEAIVAGFKALPGAVVGLGKWLNEQMDKGFKAVLEGLKGLGKWVLERWLDGLKAQAKLVVALGRWFNDRMDDAFRAVVDGLKSLGKWVLDRWVEGLKAQAAVVVALGGWIKNRIMDGLQATLEAFKGLGGWVLDKVVDGFKATVTAIEGVGDWLRRRISVGLQSVAEDVRGLGGWILDKIVDGIKAVGGKVRDAVVAIKNAIVNAIKSVFKDALNIPLKISLPKINLPFGGSGGGNVGPGAGVPGHVSGFDKIAAGFGNVVTSGYRPGDDGWHGRNRARDYSGGNMLAFARFMAANFGGKLLELIHTPLGFGIKNGQKVGLGFWGGDVNADHFDHVHVALANGGYLRKGGWAVVGERGPELAHLPTGASVYSNRDSRAMVGGSTVLHAVLDLGRGIQQRVTLEFDEHGRQMRSAYWAGA